MTQEALKLALEALEANQPVNYCMNSNGERFPMMHEDPFRFERNTKAIAAIKEALAQHDSVQAKPEPEQDHIPDARKMVTEQEPDIYPEEAYEMGLEAIAYYTTPPQRTWVGLTEDETIDLLPVGDWEIESTLGFAKAIEAKLKERNA